MNIPAGERTVSDVEINKVDVRKILLDLSKKEFTGYIAVTCSANYGFEDSTVFFKKGEIIGAIYNLLAYKKIIYGELALSLFFNIFASKNGFFDVFKLPVEQMELIVTFNDRIQFKKSLSDKEIYGNYLNEYKNSLVDKLVPKNEVKKDKYSLLKEIGLGNIGA